MIYLVLLIGVGIVFALFGAWVADQKGRDPIEGVIVGFCFGPVGVIVEALLPPQARADWDQPPPRLYVESKADPVADEARDFLRGLG